MAGLAASGEIPVSEGTRSGRDVDLSGSGSEPRLALAHPGRQRRRVAGALLTHGGSHQLGHPEVGDREDLPARLQS
jgi:hypothetical protein